MFSLVLPVLSLCISRTSEWDLSSYNIPSGYYVSSVAVYANRAFLALPRSSCFNNLTNPTMVEASFYNEHQRLLRKRPFFLDFQAWGDCRNLQDAVSLQVESSRARLWVLDRGNGNCRGKIVVYDLYQLENYTSEAPMVEDRKLNYLIVDNDPRLNGARGYVGLDGENYLLAFSITEFKWWKITLETDNIYHPVSTQYLAMARKEPVLYVTGGEERGIFSVDMTKVPREFEEDEELVVNATFRGEKLGASSALVADFKDGLSYYMPRDHVVVRWNTRKPSQAENYNVLAQSYEQLPHVSQLFSGPQNGIWALANPSRPDRCSKDAPRLDKRLVRLLKYNVFF